MVSMSAFPVLIGIGIDYAIQFHNRIDEEFINSGSPAQAVIKTVGNVSVGLCSAHPVCWGHAVRDLVEDLPHRTGRL